MNFRFIPLAVLLVLVSPEISQAASAPPLPSVELKPVLEPCLDAILAPLDKNPAMPRVKVETMRADFAAKLVVASTPAEKGVYQNAMTVCDAMTSDMDVRAQAVQQANSSATVPTMSTGGCIDESMPMRGWDAGGAGQAIRQKQKADRKYADKKAARQSAFVNSAAYTAWAKNAPDLREKVMGLYTRQTELEALYTKSITPAEPAKDTASSSKNPTLGIGSWTQGGKVRLWLSPDNVATLLSPTYKKEKGTWSVDDQGHLRAKFSTFTMKGDFSQDGKTFTRLDGTVYKLKS